MAQTTTLSAAGTSALVLNPVAKSTTVILSASVYSSLSQVQVEASLDDPTLVGGPTATWAVISSATQMSSLGSSSPLIYTILTPIAQVRLNSTLITASSAVFTLKALQSVTA